MLRYILQRLAYAVVTILIVSLAVYLIFAILPFDPAALTCGQRCRSEEHTYELQSH